MKKTLLIAASIMMCLCFNLAISAQKPKPVTCGSDVNNLRLEIFDRDSLNNLFQIRSDGKGIYYPSANEVLQFQISNCSYDFILDFNYRNSTRKESMTIPNYPVTGSNTETTSGFNNFDRVASVPITDWNDIAFREFCGNMLNTPNVVKNSNGTYKYDNYAGCGLDSAGKYYVRRNVGILSNLKSGERLRFQNSPFDGGTNAGDTSYIRVYAYQDPKGFISGNLPNTWELSPEPTVINGLTGTWAALLDGGANRIGERQASFFMILKRPR
jgi:hypothetical protein